MAYDGHKVTTEAEVKTFASSLAAHVTSGGAIEDAKAAGISIPWEKLGTPNNPTHASVALAIQEALGRTMRQTDVDVLTFKTMKDMAVILHVNPELLRSIMDTQALTSHAWAGEVLAMKAGTDALAEKLLRAAMNVPLGKTSLKDVETAMVDYATYADKYTQIKAGHARATVSGRISVGEIPGSASKELLELVQQNLKDRHLADFTQKVIATEERTEKLIPLMMSSLGTRIFQAHNEAWVNSLLSSLPSLTIDTKSNIAQTVFLPERAVGGALMHDRAAIRTGMGTYAGLRRQVMSGIEYIHAASRVPGTVPERIGNIFDAAKDSNPARTFNREVSILNPGNMPLEYHTPAISAKAFDVNPDSMFGWALDHVGRVIRVPLRLRCASDELFKGANFHAYADSLLTEQAVAEGATRTPQRSGSSWRKAEAPSLLRTAASTWRTPSQRKRLSARRRPPSPAPFAMDPSAR